MQKQSKKAERGQSPLVCTHKNCKALQTADGEYCEKHYPKEAGEIDHIELEKKLNRLYAELRDRVNVKTMSIICEIVENELLLESLCDR